MKNLKNEELINIYFKKINEYEIAILKTQCPTNKKELRKMICEIQKKIKLLQNDE